MCLLSTAGMHIYTLKIRAHTCIKIFFGTDRHRSSVTAESAHTTNMRFSFCTCSYCCPTEHVHSVCTCPLNEWSPSEAAALTLPFALSASSGFLSAEPRTVQQVGSSEEGTGKGGERVRKLTTLSNIGKRRVEHGGKQEKTQRAKDVKLKCNIEERKPAEKVHIIIILASYFLRHGQLLFLL